MDEVDMAGMASALPTFRAKKRQKLYRKRIEDEDSVSESGLQSTMSPPSQTLDELINSASIPTELPAPISVGSLLRHRQSLQRKRLGIEFSVSKIANDSLESRHRSVNDAIDQVAIGTDQNEDFDMVAMRFAPQTGQVADVADKHMMAYIDAELAKRAVASRSTPQASPAISNKADHVSTTLRQLKTEHQDHSVHRQPAALGKIFEIDLGPDARARNVAATQAAQRRLHGDNEGEDGEPEVEKAVGKKRKPRLGRDGKPLPPRRQKRRTSEDLNRDKLVEEILKESKLSLDLDPAAALAGAAPRSPVATTALAYGEEGDTEAADDRIAEQFRHDYMEAMSGRRRRTAASSSTTNAGKSKAAGEKEERLKGPKLGGSRSTRAAMREKGLELQREREKEKRFGRR